MMARCSPCCHHAEPPTAYSTRVHYIVWRHKFYVATYTRTVVIPALSPYSLVLYVHTVHTYIIAMFF